VRSIDAIELPPAPMVVTSMSGRHSGIPHSTSNSPENISWPSTMTPTSALVPPMSRVTARSEPSWRHQWFPAMTPPASPESTSSAGRAAARASGTWPPFDFMSACHPPTARRCSPSARDSQKPVTIGLTKASIVVVLARSYSRQIGATSLDTETARPGKT
jgi:hypothetical protein